MAYGFDDSTVDLLMAAFQQMDKEPLKKVMEIILNNLMVIERERHNNAASYERSIDRADQSNGFKPKTYTTRLGKLDLKVPQRNLSTNLRHSPNYFTEPSSGSSSIRDLWGGFIQTACGP